MGARDIFNAFKAKQQLNRVNRQAYQVLSPKLTPATVAGEKNYNTEHKILKQFTDRGDVQGGANYVKQQQQKLLAQRRK